MPVRRGSWSQLALTLIYKPKLCQVSLRGGIRGRRRAFTNRVLIAHTSIIQADRWEQQKNCSVALQPNAQHDVHNAPRGAPLAEIHGNPEALKPWPDKRAT